MRTNKTNRHKTNKQELNPSTLLDVKLLPLRSSTGRRLGWYPAYWEYGMAVCALRWDDDWCLWIDNVLEPFVSEAAWFQSRRLELWSWGSNRQRWFEDTRTLSIGDWDTAVILIVVHGRFPFLLLLLTFAGNSNHAGHPPATYVAVCGAECRRT